MKNNELLTLILAELRKLNGVLKPDVLIPPAYVKTFLHGPACDQILYSNDSERGNMVHGCYKNANHENTHSTIVYNSTINWYTN